MGQTYLLVLLLVMTAAGAGHSARILGLFPIPVKSHLISFTALTKELAARGHLVTVVSTFPQNKPLANYIDIVVENSLPEEEKKTVFSIIQRHPVPLLKMYWDIGIQMCESMLQQPNIQKLINDKDLQFDLVIFEGFFCECFLGFIHKLKAPTIHISSNTAMLMVGDQVGNPSPFSVVPDIFFSFGDHMTFVERLTNTLFNSYNVLSRSLYYMPRQEAVMKKYFKDTDLPSIWELETNTSLLLLNSHIAFNFPRAYTPNTIEVGGMHIKPPKKLPQDLQKFLDDAPEGVIYFSMGSNMRSSDLPEAKRDAFLKAFSGLKQKVLWKWETDELPGQPKNVKLGKWLPQNDILGHPNVKVFITHGGLLSTQEAVSHGVPILAIPVFADQRMNAAQAERSGLGLSLEITTLTAEDISSALDKILSQPSFRDNMKRRSAIFHDQPEKPLDRAVYWTEYVLRHKGAPHMRSAALDLAWYQIHLLDVIGVLVGVIVFSMVLVVKTCRVVCGVLNRSKKIEKSKKTN